MTKNLTVSLAVLGMAMSANAQSLASSTNATQNAAASLSQLSTNLSGKTVDGIMISGNVIMEATIRPTMNGATAVFEVSIKPMAQSSGRLASATGNAATAAGGMVVNGASKVANSATNAASAAGQSVYVHVLQPTAAGATAVGASAVDAVLASYDHVLVPLTDVSGDAAEGVSDAAQFVAVKLVDFAQEASAQASATGRYSWNQVLVPVAEYTMDASVAAGGMTMQYVIRPTADVVGEAAELIADGTLSAANAVSAAGKSAANAASAAGKSAADAASAAGQSAANAASATGNAASASAQISADAASNGAASLTNATGDLSAVSGASVDASLGKKREQIGQQQRQSRAKRRAEQREALKGN